MFSVEVAASGREALERFPGSDYTAIICDMLMPGMSGKQLYEVISKDFPHLQSRFILLTGDLASEATWNFVEERRLPYVLKPVSPSELRRKVQEVSERSDSPTLDTPSGSTSNRPSTDDAASGLEVDLEHERRASRRLAQALQELEQALSERDQFVAENIKCGSQIRELTVAKAMLLNTVDQLMGMVERLQTDLAQGRAEWCEQGSAVADLSKQLADERATACTLARELADLTGLYEEATSERDRLVQENSNCSL